MRCGGGVESSTGPIRCDPDQGEPHRGRRRHRSKPSRARANTRRGVPLEVEVETLAQLAEALGYRCATGSCSTTSRWPTCSARSSCATRTGRRKELEVSGSIDVDQLAPRRGDRRGLRLRRRAHEARACHRLLDALPVDASARRSERVTVGRLGDNLHEALRLSDCRSLARSRSPCHATS